MRVTTTIGPGPRSTDLERLDQEIESHPIWTELRGPVNGQNKTQSTPVAQGTISNVASGAQASYQPSLSATQQYQYRVRASNGTATGAWSDWYFFATGGCAAQLSSSPVLSLSDLTSRVDHGSVVLSGLVHTTPAADVDGSIWVEDAAGYAVDGSPLATGTVSNGDRLTYAIPAGTLTSGNSYKWMLGGSAGSACVSRAMSGWMNFAGPSPWTAPTPTNQVEVSGAGLATTSAPDGTTDCSTSPCALSNATLSLGIDGSGHDRVGTLKADLSSIPTGAVISSASLKIAPASSTCLTGAFFSYCSSDVIQVAEASSDVASLGTGASALSAESGPAVAGALSDGTIDVTPLISDWVDGAAPNYGAILSIDSSTSSNGVELVKPTPVSATSLKLEIAYTPPAAPSAPSVYQVLPGDAGVAVSWAPSENRDPGSAMSYVVEALAPSGVVAVTTTATSSPAILHGLSNGTSYTVRITATNPAGTSDATTSAAVTPTAVSGGTQSYTTAVTQEMNALDDVQAGVYQHVSSAIANDSYQTWIASEANASDAWAVDLRTRLSAANEQLTNYSTSMTDSLVSQSVSGTVTVYTYTHTTFTTVDSSLTPTVSIPGEGYDDTIVTFQNSQITAEADTSATINPPDASSTNMYSAALDGDWVNNAPAPATDGTGSYTAATSKPGVRYADLSGVRNWAVNNWQNNPHYYDNDCTDFVSKALAVGGGLRQQTHYWAASLGSVFSDNRDWFGPDVDLHSRSWSISLANFRWQNLQTAEFLPYWNLAEPGDVVWANWHGSSARGIEHAAIVNYVRGNNFFVTQDDNPYLAEPVLLWTGHRSWQGVNPNMHYWIDRPSQLTSPTA